MKGFYSIFQLLILFVLVLNSGIVYIFMSNTFDLTTELRYAIFFTSIVLEFLIIMSIIKKFFYEPIFTLKFYIQKFYAGRLKNQDIVIGKSLNRDMNLILSFFANTLNTLKNIKEEFIHGKEIKSEVELGKEIQGKMLEKKLTPIPSLEVIVKSRPAWEIGWDSYDIIKQDDNYYIYVADATGHWVGAGFIMIMVNALVSAFAKVYKNGAAILAKTNEILKPRVKANLLMSLLMVRWDEQEKRLFMTGAGHEYLMIYKHKQKKTFRIKSGWVALGMIRDISKLLKEKEIKFEENDVIVMYSDGITEAINRPTKDGSESMFLEDRLEESINNSPVMQWHDYKSARSIFNNITIDLSKFMGYKHVQLDDVTLAVIHYKWENHNPENDAPEVIPDDFITERNW